MTMSDSFPIIRKSDLSQVSVSPNLDYENADKDFKLSGLGSMIETGKSKKSKAKKNAPA